MGSLIFKGFFFRGSTQTPRLLSDVNRRKALKQIGHLFKDQLDPANVFCLKTRQKGFQTRKRKR